jgi:hypothetical protein
MSKTANPVTGQICYCSWGYGQTNIDWYVVTKVLPKSVRVASIRGDTKETGFMCGVTLPRQPVELDSDEELLRRWKPNENYGWVANMSFGCLVPWDGKPQRCSWYH